MLRNVGLELQKNDNNGSPKEFGISIDSYHDIFFEGFEYETHFSKIVEF